MIFRFPLALACLTLALVAGSASAQQYTTCALANATTAVSLAEGSSTSGTTVGAASTSVTLACPTSTSYTGPSVWYRFVPPHSGDVTISTCGSSFDTVLSVHTACTGTGTGTLRGCNNDGAGCAPASAVTLFVQAGYPYLVRVGGVAGASGEFTLNVGAVAYKTRGPDVAVWAISDVARNAPGTYESRAFFDPVSGTYTTAQMESLSIGTTSTNYGDLQVDWRDSNAPSGGIGNYSNQSPAIAQNIFKYQPVSGQSYGRFRQLGQGWLKVGFTSTNSNGGPGTCVQTPLGGDQLGINCLDTYGSSLNGTQGYLAPRSSVHVSSGYYTPWRNNAGASGDYLFKRVELPSSEYVSNWGGSPATYTTTSRYFAEGYYVAYEDALWNNGRNNMSWHELLVTSASASPAKATGNSHRLEPAIAAWKVMDPAVTLANADHIYTVISPGTSASNVASAAPGYVGDNRSNFPPSWPRDVECRYVVGAKVTDLGNGQWHYEYAIYNINSDRSGGSFSMRLPFGAAVSNAGQTYPMCHSGEPYSNQYVELATGVTPDATNTPNGAWSWTAADGKLVFTADGTYASKVNANAVRWGTLYNFWFDCNVPPTNGWARIGLFKPAYDGTDPSVNSPAGRVARDLAQSAYASVLPTPTICIPDLATTGGALGPDGQVTVDDLTLFLARFFANDLAADIASLGGALVPDDQISADDLIAFLSTFFAGCGS
ncbi:MAG: GC-type dockerin domain-anchored protein [Phycisphaerales bacterium]